MPSNLDVGSLVLPRRIWGGVGSSMIGGECLQQSPSQLHQESLELQRKSEEAIEPVPISLEEALALPQNLAIFFMPLFIPASLLTSLQSNR